MNSTGLAAHKRRTWLSCDQGMHKNFLRTIQSAALTACLALTACGGGGGNAGTSSSAGSPPTGGTSTYTGGAGVAAPSNGPGDTANIFPTTQGSTWLYDATDTSTTTPGYGTLTIAGTQVISGVTTTVFSYSSTIADETAYNEYYTSTGGGVTLYGSSDPGDFVTNQIVPYATLLFPGNPGATIANISKSNLSLGTASNGDALTGTASLQLVDSGTETVTVGAGVFPNSVKITNNISFLATDAKTSQSGTSTGTDTKWFAPGVGLVQEVQVINGVTSQSWALRQYQANGVVHGMGKASTVNASAQYVDSNPHYQGSSAGSGSSVLNVVWQNSNLTAIVSDVNGNQLSSIPLQSANAVTVGGAYPCFDGTNFEVFKDGASATFGIHVQRISATGQAIDPIDTNLVYAGTGSLAAVSCGKSAALIVVMSMQGSSAPTLPGTWTLSGLFVGYNGGQPLSAPFTIASGTGAGANVSPVATDGTNFLIPFGSPVYSSAGSPPGSQFQFVRVNSAGTVLDTAPFVLSSTPGIGMAAAYDGTNFMVVWADSGGAELSATILGTRVSPAGALLDGAAKSGAIVVSSSTAQQRQCPGLVFNGSEYIATWSNYGIRAARITKAGSVSSGSGFEIQVSQSLSSDEPYAPAITTLSNGVSVVNWNNNPGLGSVSISPF